MNELEAKIDAAKINLELARTKLQREGPSIVLWDAVHAAEDKIANLRQRWK